MHLHAYTEFAVSVKKWFPDIHILVSVTLSYDGIRHYTQNAAAYHALNSQDDLHTAQPLLHVYAKSVNYKGGRQL